MCLDPKDVAEIGFRPRTSRCAFWGNFTGAELVFPRWRLGVAFKRGDLLFFNPQEIHGNLAFEGERTSCALYCAGGILKCGQ